MNYYIGIDIGSTCAKTVVLDENKTLLLHLVQPTGWSSVDTAQAIQRELREAGFDPEQLPCVATGYGRISVPFADKTVTEITCHGRGATLLHGGEELTVIDIGGQDTKALQLSAAGILERFVMNDKCAAGTGRFLEVMARILEADMGELAELDERSRNPVSISSTCTVFAESEVISRLSDGAAREDIVRGIHDSIAARAAGLCARLQVCEPVFLSGGLSRDQGLVRALERRLGCPVETAELSVYAGALGAALLAYRRLRRQEREAQNG